MNHQIKQRGFTLIELLVVVAIMGTLLGLVAISNRPSRKTQLRMAAQSVASLVVAAQSNALDSEVGSALWISSDGVYDANPRQNIVLSVGSVNKIPSNATSPTQFGLTGSIVPKEPIPSQPDEERASAFRVRFLSTASVEEPPSPWFGVLGETARFQSYQTVHNTIWPARFYDTPNSPQCRAEFALYPQKTSVAYQWPRLAKIDWRYSGIGSTSPLIGDAAITFDASGKIANYFQDLLTIAVSGNHAMSTLYLCIAYAPDVDAGAATLSNEDTVWVAIEPSTARATLAWNVPTTLSDLNAPTGTDLLAARANVIAGKGLAD